jgi:hypothetical protein
MRGRSALAILLAILLSVPIVGGTTTTTVEDEETEDPCMEDPEQPCENQTVLYLWSNGQSTHWSHFNPVDSNNVASNEFSREKDSGVIDIDERFTMKPSLNKKLSMAVDGEIRVVLNITVEGDWTNDNDADSACGQNDCEELNITLWSGATQIFRQHVPGLSQGENTIMFTYRITEEQSLWDKSTSNPSLQIEMKLRGNYNPNSGPGGFFVEGEPAEFTLGLSADWGSRIEMPIDPLSWDEEFQEDEEMAPAEEDGFLPGFVFMSALATMSLAAVYLPSKDESEDI